MRHFSILAFTSLLFLSNAYSEIIKVGGTGSGMGTINILSKAYMKKNNKIQFDLVQNLGTSGGIKAVVKNSLDIAVTSRALKSDEISLGVIEHQYGVSPFFVATSNMKVKNIKMSELEDYYSGRKQHWSDGSRVRPLLRPKEDWDHTLLSSFSPKMKVALDEAHQSQSMIVASTDQVMADKIESLEGALGTVTLALVISEDRKMNRPKLDGVAPTVENLKNRKYKFSKTMYVVTQKNPSKEIQNFINFIFSPEGKKIIKKMGHMVNE